MRKSLELSAIALLSTALTILPAYALSLNVGGNGPLVDIGNDNNADATLSVDTGNVLGSGGSSDTNSDAAIDLNLGSIDNDAGGGLLGSGNGLIDLGGDNDNQGSVIDLDGDLLDLGNSGEVLDFGGTGNLLDLGTDGDLLDLGGSGNLLDLGGDDLLNAGGNTRLLALDLSGSNAAAGLNLDGGDEPVVDVTISNNEDGLAGTGLLPEGSAGAGNAALITITSPDSGGDDGGTGGGDNGNGGGSGGNGAGSGDGSGSGGGGAGGNGPGSAGNGPGSNGAGGAIVAANADACMTLDTAQLDELVGRHIYNRATFNSWASAQSLKIVEVNLCEAEISEVAAMVGASTNVAQLQAFLAAQAKVRAGLQSKGYAPSDVIAADHGGEVLTVYVI